MVEFNTIIRTISDSICYSAVCSLLSVHYSSRFPTITYVTWVTQVQPRLPIWGFQRKLPTWVFSILPSFFAKFDDFQSELYQNPL